MTQVGKESTFAVAAGIALTTALTAVPGRQLTRPPAQGPPQPGLEVGAGGCVQSLNPDRFSKQEHNAGFLSTNPPAPFGQSAQARER